MGIQISNTEPELIGVFTTKDDPELHQLRQMVESINQDLVDSGFGHFHYDVQLRGQRAYIIKV